MRIFPTLFKTGRHAARRAAAASEEATKMAAAERQKYEQKTAEEKRKASKIRVRALRGRRSAAFFEQGSETIG